MLFHIKTRKCTVHIYAHKNTPNKQSIWVADNRLAINKIQFSQILHCNCCFFFFTIFLLISGHWDLFKSNLYTGPNTSPYMPTNTLQTTIELCFYYCLLFVGFFLDIQFFCCVLFLLVLLWFQFSIILLLICIFSSLYLSFVFCF